MMEAWWTAEQGNFWFAIAGAGLGTLGGLLGLMLALCSRRGILRRLLLGLESVLLVLGLVSLVGGIVAVSSSQPYMVWYPLTLIGLLLTLLMPGMIWVTRTRYAQVEARRLAAEQLRRS